MREPSGSLFPVVQEAGDGRLDELGRIAKVVGHELELIGFPRTNAEDRQEIALWLREFCFGSRGPAGELEKRLNGTAPPLVSDEGHLDSYDCTAVAHEIRRKRGAEGAMVIAVGENGRVHIGCAVEPSSQADLVAAKIMASLDDATLDSADDVVLDFVVDGKGPKQ